ncbi:MAG: hypothetical protein R2861_16705 [Desulfobacterales bacterium]
MKKSGKIKLNTALFNDMIQYRLTDGEYEQNLQFQVGTERPPMNQVPEYGRRLNR